MVYKAIIFDLDGTLLDGEERHYRCYSDILRELGGEPLKQADYWREKRKGYQAKQLLELTQATDKIALFEKRWLEEIEKKEYLALDQLYPQVATILQQWQANGTKLFLATLRKNVANLYWQLEQLNLLPYFVAVTVANNPVEKAEWSWAKLQQQEREKALWIGDSEVDAKAARLLNIPLCLLSCGLRNEAFLKKLKPDYLEQSLSTFAENRK